MKSKKLPIKLLTNTKISDVNCAWCDARKGKDVHSAAPGFMKPEGIVLFHAQGNILLKKTFDKDQEWKGKQ